MLIITTNLVFGLNRKLTFNERLRSFLRIKDFKPNTLFTSRRILVMSRKRVSSVFVLYNWIENDVYRHKGFLPDTGLLRDTSVYKSFA